MPAVRRMSRRASASGGSTNTSFSSRPAAAAPGRSDPAGWWRRARRRRAAVRCRRVGEQRGHHAVGDPGVELCPRRGASASISSRNTSEGAESRARRNNSRTAFSEEPTHLSMSSAPLTACTVSRPGARQRAHEERLTAARRAVQQHAARRVDAEPGERIGMPQRPQHRLGERLLGLDHVADVVERDRPDREFLGGRPGQRPDHRSAPMKSACISAGGLPSSLARAAARSAASRTAPRDRRPRIPVCAKRSRRGRDSRRDAAQQRFAAEPCGWPRRAGSGRARGRRVRDPAAGGRRGRDAPSSR